MFSWGSQLPHFPLVQDISPDIKLSIGLNKESTKMFIYIELRMV